MKKLSIIIPLYNTPKPYLKQCLDSCKKSEDIEVIVIDDGSTINYKDLIANYDIRYIKIPNGGVSEARNLGMKIATGEYITFLDSDDKMNNINDILGQLDKKDIILTRSYLLKNGLKANKYTFNDSQEMNPQDLKRDMFILEYQKIDCLEPVWSKFYKRSFLAKNHLTFSEYLKRDEDVLFNYEAYSRTNSILYLNEFSYICRMNNESITRRFDETMDVNTYELLYEFELLFNKLDITDENYPLYVFRLIVRLMRKYFVHLTEEEYNQKIDLLFNNVIIDYYLHSIDVYKLDSYKKQLHRLLLLKDKIKVYDYLREVCDKKLLKK